MRVLAVLLSVTLVAPAAWAEDPPAPEPATPRVVAALKFPFGLKHIVPPADVTPEGWTKADGEAPADAPTKEALLAIAKAAGVPEKATHARVLVIRKGDGDAAKTAVAAWVAVDVDHDEMITKMHDGLEEKGWLVKEVSIPQRVLVTWAVDMEDARALQTWQTEKAVRSLCQTGWAMLTAAAQDSGQIRQERIVDGQALIQAAHDTEPEAALVNAMIAALLAQQSPGAALTHTRKALAKDAPVPLSDEWLVQVAYAGGRALLTRMDKSVLEEAKDMLLRGVEAEQSAPNPMMRFGNRYNLACAYARLGKTDDAFKHLEESFRYLRKAWEEDKKKSFSGMSQLDYPNHFEHAKRVDTDMEPLRKVERWAKFLAKYDPAPKPAAEAGKDGDK